MAYFTILSYLVKTNVKQLGIVSAIIVVVLVISSAFDTIQKFRSYTMTFSEFWFLVLDKVPYLFCEVSVVAIFVASVFFLHVITKTNELIIILSNGVAPWQVFAVPIISAAIFGLFVLLFIQPLGVEGLKEYARLESHITNTDIEHAVNQRGSIFFQERNGNNNRIIQFRSIDFQKSELLDVTILVINNDNALRYRIDCPKALLTQGHLKLLQPSIMYEGHPETIQIDDIDTILSLDQLRQKKSISPETMHLSHLKTKIDTMNPTDFMFIKYQFSYFKQLLKPMYMMAMASMACWFVNLNLRQHANMKLVLGIVFGISAYFLLEVLHRILAYNGLSPLFAVLLPVGFILSVSHFVILHFQ